MADKTKYCQLYDAQGERCTNETYEYVNILLAGKTATFNACQYHFEQYLSRPHEFMYDLDNAIGRLLAAHDADTGT